MGQPDLLDEIWEALSTPIDVGGPRTESTDIGFLFYWGYHHGG